MTDSGFQASEIEEDGALFLSLLSKVLIVEAEKFIILKSISNKIYGSSKKRTMEERLQEESSSVPFSVDIDLLALPVQAIIETKRHNIYYIAMPNGLRAVKATAGNPTIEDKINLDNELKIGTRMNCPGFRKANARTTYHNKEVLLSEWANGN